jgi:predicted small secreted protein
MFTSRLKPQPVLVAALAVVLSAGATASGFGDIFKSIGSAVDSAQPLGGGTATSAAASSLSNSEIDAGLKQALSVGAKRAVELLGKNGGFLNDPSVRIPLPGVLQTVGKGLRAAGQGQYVDQFEQTVNRAAEQAIPKTLDIVQRTVQNMTLDDVRGILGGGDDAATEYLRRHAGKSLREAIEPIVAQATDSAGVTAAYKQMMAQYGGSLSGSLGALGGLLGGGSGGTPQSLNLDDYVTGKALDGLFLKLATEEKAIRENPVARSTDLLKQVFGG